MERVSMALSSLQTQVTQRENDELAKERGFQDFFAIFLREIIPPGAALDQYISLTPYEVDMWVNNGIGTQEKISSFIEMKTNEEDLYYVLLQACLYAYKYCIIKKKTRLFVKVAAVSLPGYRAQIGEMFIELNPETLDVVKHSSYIKMGKPFSWEDQEGALKLVSHILPRPQKRLLLHVDT